jgi:regulator of sigma D
MEGSDEEVKYIVDTNKDYRQEFLDKYPADSFLEESVDDSYIELKHKKALFAYCKSMVDSKYNQYPEPMYTLLIKKIIL